MRELWFPAAVDNWVFKVSGAKPALARSRLVKSRNNPGLVADGIVKSALPYLVWVIDSHKQEEIIEVLKQQPLAVREQVCEVSIDMWAGFPKVITSVFPKAAVVFDRFHVMKLVNEALNKMRKQVGVKLKGSRFLLLRNFRWSYQLCD